ncbi:MAG: ATP synthase F1 subunit gamma [Deltaproteobacteria bacterium CG11_big_fil_rev_8_21_14_0_20_45_16]|nr:MAG: ATP synthase F1 subunit gamma [Deltaproteobacteria bacterium CG11_big_fil_rev_8_21_14_0_20_45_16]
MPSLKFIRKRISSVKNTQKITKAMKMVSAAKLRRAQERAQSSRPYEKQLSGIVAGILRDFDYQSDLTEKRDGPRIGLVVVSTDRGLCGSLNANLFKKVSQYLKVHSHENIELIALGKKARDFFSKRGVKVHSTHLDLMKIGSYEYIESIAETLKTSFESKIFDRVEVFYSEFQSALVQNAKQECLLPLPIESMLGETDAELSNFIMEPTGGEMLDRLLPLLVRFKLYRMVIESLASEHAARMAAMDSATRNARDMIGRLTLDMNRARQAAITKELMEIIGGAEAVSA